MESTVIEPKPKIERTIEEEYQALTYKIENDLLTEEQEEALTWQPFDFLVKYLDSKKNAEELIKLIGRSFFQIKIAARAGKNNPTKALNESVINALSDRLKNPDNLTTDEICKIYTITT